VDAARVLEATGRSLGDWFAILDERGANDLTHKDIAKLLTDECGVPGWWSQSVTVEYERHIGRREAGQRQDGSYEVAVTRTVPGAMDDVLARWLARVPAPEAGFAGVRFAGAPSTSRTEKRRAWRVTLEDGSRVEVAVSDKPVSTSKGAGPACLLAVTSSKLAAKSDGDRWKVFWRAYLGDI
jgi:hypothetical protein